MNSVIPESITVAGRIVEPTVSVHVYADVAYIRIDDRRNPSFWTEVRIPAETIAAIAAEMARGGRVEEDD